MCQPDRDGCPNCTPGCNGDPDECAKCKSRNDALAFIFSHQRAVLDAYDRAQPDTYPFSYGDPEC